MGSRMAKPALDVGLVTRDAEPLLRFYAGVVCCVPGAGSRRSPIPTAT